MFPETLSAKMPGLRRDLPSRYKLLGSPILIAKPHEHASKLGDSRTSEMHKADLIWFSLVLSLRLHRRTERVGFG